MSRLDRTAERRRGTTSNLVHLASAVPYNAESQRVGFFKAVVRESDTPNEGCSRAMSTDSDATISSSVIEVGSLGSTATVVFDAPEESAIDHELLAETAAT